MFVDKENAALAAAAMKSGRMRQLAMDLQQDDLLPEDEDDDEEDVLFLDEKPSSILLL